MAERPHPRSPSAAAAPHPRPAPQSAAVPAPPRISLDQRRAAFAWDAVTRLKDPDKYANLAKAAPALVMSNGLMQTLAFFAAKNEKHHLELSRHIFEWLGPEARILPGVRDYASAMDALVNSRPETYRRATEEVFALLRWIRQFAAAGQGGGGR